MRSNPPGHVSSGKRAVCANNEQKRLFPVFFSKTLVSVVWCEWEGKTVWSLSPKVSRKFTWHWAKKKSIFYCRKRSRTCLCIFYVSRKNTRSTTLLEIFYHFDLCSVSKSVKKSKVHKAVVLPCQSSTSVETLWSVAVFTMKCSFKEKLPSTVK